MKTIYYILIWISTFFAFSCQKEELEIIDENNPETLTQASPLTGLIARVSQNPTASDNILDNSSCFKVQLPVTVIVNGKNITVTSEADYILVKNAIDAFSNDDDIVNFIYPFTIQFQNFQIRVIDTPNEFDNVLDDCGEDDGFDEIDCIKIVYPLVVNVYDAGSQSPTVLTFTNNQGLFNFIKNLDNNDFISIKYPITVINSNNQQVSITNNKQFEEFIENAIDDCDVPVGGGGGNTGDLSTLLTSNSWKVSYFFDEKDETSFYSNYTFVFLANGTVKAQQGSSFINGTWSTYLDNGIRKLLLNFDGDILKDFEEDWKLIEFTSSEIRLKDVSGGDGSVSYLYFTKI